MQDNNPYKIIERLKKGDRKVFREIYIQYFDTVYFFALQYLDNAHLAEDLVQDTFLKLWEIRDNLNDDTNLRNFLFSIAKNKCLNCLRDEKIKYKHHQNIRFLELQYNYEALLKLDRKNLEYDELVNKLNDAINKLPPDIKDIFLMSRTENLKYREIAEKLNISQKTVEAKMSKALILLRNELKDYFFLIFFLLFITK